MKMDIRICIPSYKRPKVETLKYLPFAKVFIDKSEEVEYRKSNKGADIVVVPDGVQGNLCRIRNHIMKTQFEDGADVVLIVDDDMKGCYRWVNSKKKLIQSSDFLAFVEEYSIIARDMNVYMWGLNINQDKQVYREYTPFSTTSYIGGPFQAFMKGNELYYDERLSLKEDYDMTLQQLNKYRKALRVNNHFYIVKQSENPGGCASYRNYVEEERQLMLLQSKWGSKVVKLDINDRSHNRKKEKTRIDYNPIIKVPIKGV